MMIVPVVYLISLMLSLELDADMCERADWCCLSKEWTVNTSTLSSYPHYGIYPNSDEWYVPRNISLCVSLKFNANHGNTAQ